MQYRTLAGTSLHLSEISFGAWAAGGWMWGGNEKNDAIDAIRKSWELGVNNIDTAAVYGQGESEEIIGEAIKTIRGPMAESSLWALRTPQRLIRCSTTILDDRVF